MWIDSGLSIKPSVKEMEKVTIVACLYQGWKAPTSEPESSAQREEAANALVQLQRNNIPENTH